MKFLCLPLHFHALEKHFTPQGSGEVIHLLLLFGALASRGNLCGVSIARFLKCVCCLDITVLPEQIDV